MTRTLAWQTIAQIDAAIAIDQGAAYRGWMQKVLPHIGDAYSTDTFPFRSHLGISTIGEKCPRKPWLTWRWGKIVIFPSKMLRLFNRGHLEEGRVIAALLAAGLQVYQQDENGKQFRVCDESGHFGGSGDGIVIGCPDVPVGERVLLEIKTSNDKKFTIMERDGVIKAQPKHYVQCQCYMKEMGLAYALYIVVNKNNDALYMEIIPYNEPFADEYWRRGESLVAAEEVPSKISSSSSAWECKYCEYSDICHNGEKPERTCRSCKFGRPVDGGKWECINFMCDATELDKTAQFEACKHYKGII